MRELSFGQMILPDCLYCDGRGGGIDPYPSGEAWECFECQESGRMWRWQLWWHRFKLWRMDREIERLCRGEGMERDEGASQNRMS